MKNIETTVKTERTIEDIMAEMAAKRIDGTTMPKTATKAQKKKICRFLKNWFNEFKGTTRNIKLKNLRFMSSLDSSRISVVIETGMKNDEGTAASWICRDSLQIFVGSRGGVNTPNQKSINIHNLFCVAFDEKKIDKKRRGF